MHEFILFNGRVCDKTDAVLAAVSGASLFGKGIFTTIAVYDGQPLLWEKHWKRLIDAATKLDIDINKFKESAVRDAVGRIVTRNDVASGRARVTFFDESPTDIWTYEAAPKTSLLIFTGDSRTVPERYQLTLSPYLINTASPLTGVKSCNYLEPLLASGEAKRRGFHEAVRINERGEIASACMANLFWLKGDRLLTPSLKTGCLAGTTREFVLESLMCEEVETGIEALQTADAMFLTFAGSGVVRVGEFEGRKLGGEGHQILSVLPFSNG